jgi:hypothetical protein
MKLTIKISTLELVLCGINNLIISFPQSPSPWSLSVAEVPVPQSPRPPTIVGSFVPRSTRGDLQQLRVLKMTFQTAAYAVTKPRSRI